MEDVIFDFISFLEKLDVRDDIMANIFHYAIPKVIEKCFCDIEDPRVLVEMFEKIYHIDDEQRGKLYEFIMWFIMYYNPPLLEF